MDPARVCEKKDILALNMDSSICECTCIMSINVSELKRLTYPLGRFYSSEKSVESRTRLDDVRAERHLNVRHCIPDNEQ